MTDRNAAADFVELLTGDAASVVTFQLFDDDQARRDPTMARTIHDTLGNAWSRLATANTAGAGVFVTVNETNGRRRSCDVVGVRALFIDCDAGLPDAWHLEPSFVVETPGGGHAYWLVDDCELDAFGDAQRRLIRRYNSDRSVNNLDRVLRLPGFEHCKGERVRIRAAEGNGESYDLADVLLGLPDTTANTWADGAKTAAATAPATQGDLRTLDVRSLFESVGLYRRAMGGRKHAVVCPWEHEHSTPGGDGDTSSVAWSGEGDRWGSFKCQHSHCATRTIRDVVDKLGSAAVAVHCAEPYAAPVAAFERGDDVEVGQDLARRLGARSGAVHDESALWRFVDPLWRIVPDRTLERACHEYAGRPVAAAPDRQGNPRTRPLKLGQRQIKGAVAVAVAHLDRPGFFADAPEGAAFAGSFARVDGVSVVVEPLAKSHRVRATHLSPYVLPERAVLPEVVEYLFADTWHGCDDRDERAQYLIEWLGLALLGISTRYKDSPLVVGKKDTGKSRILDVIACVFPRASRRSVPLHAMANEYHRAHLAGGRINFVNELPSRELLDGEAAKAILSGDTVNCRHPAGRPFDWTPRIGNAFACNELPPSLDRALLDRFVLLDCPNVVPPERQDKDLRGKIEACAPAIARVALHAAGHTLARGHLIRPASASRAGDLWAIESDPVAMWAKVSITDDVDARAKGSHLYGLFRLWCDDNGHRPMSSTRFGKRLLALDYERVRADGMKWLVRELEATERRAARSWRDW